jgi:hypothetical protein
MRILITLIIGKKAPSKGKGRIVKLRIAADLSLEFSFIYIQQSDSEGLVAKLYDLKVHN